MGTSKCTIVALGAPRCGGTVGGSNWISSCWSDRSLCDILYRPSITKMKDSERERESSVYKMLRKNLSWAFEPVSMSYLCRFYFFNPFMWEFSLNLLFCQIRFFCGMSKCMSANSWICFFHKILINLYFLRTICNTLPKLQEQARRLAGQGRCGSSRFNSYSAN